MLLVAYSTVLRNVANDRRADTEIEQAVVAGDRENQNPESECIVTQPVQDVGRNDDAGSDVHQQAQPTGAHIPDNSEFVEALHEGFGWVLLSLKQAARFLVL